MKTSINYEEFITLLDSMDNGVSYLEAIRKFDPEVTPEFIHYLQARFKNRSGNPFKVGAEILREERETPSIVTALILISYGNFRLGAHVTEKKFQRDMEEKIDEVMGNLVKNFKK